MVCSIQTAWEKMEAVWTLFAGLSIILFIVDKILLAARAVASDENGQIPTAVIEEESDSSDAEEELHHEHNQPPDSLHDVTEGGPRDDESVQA